LVFVLPEAIPIPIGIEAECFALGMKVVLAERPIFEANRFHARGRSPIPATFDLDQISRLILSHIVSHMLRIRVRAVSRSVFGPSRFAEEFLPFGASLLWQQPSQQGGDSADFCKWGKA
jgi:hypothetical protein